MNQDTASTSAAEQELFIPQANSVERLIDLLEATGADAATTDDLADALGVSSRTVHYYAQLADWLNFATTPERGTLLLTSAGRRFVESVDSRQDIYRQALLSHELCRRIVERAGDGGDVEAAALEIIQEITTLADSTAGRRAAALASLLRAAEAPKPARSQSRSSANAEKASPRDEAVEVHEEVAQQPVADDEAGDDEEISVDVLDPPGQVSAILEHFEIETVGDLHDIDLADVRDMKGVGPTRFDAFRELVHQARVAVSGPEAVTEMIADEDVETDTPIEDVDPPGQVSSIVERLEIETVGELLEVDLGEVRRMKGVGPGRLDAMREWVERTRAQFDDELSSGVTDTSSSVLSRMLERSNIDLDTLWKEVLVDLSARSANGLDAGGWTTLGEAADAVSDGRYRDISGIGQSSVDEMREILGAVAEQGVDVYVYGDAGRPKAIGELVEAALGWLEPTDRSLLEARIFHDVKLREIGEERGLTRQRIQQIEDGILNQLHRRFGKVANELLAPVVSGLQMSAGLLHVSLLDNFTDEADPKRLKLGLLIAGEDDADVRLDEFLTTLSTPERDKLIRQIRDGLQELDGVRATLPDAIAVMGEAGLFVDAHAAARFLALVFEIDAGDDGTFSLRWRSHRDVVAEVLLGIGRASNTEDLMDAYDKMRAKNPELELHELAPHALQAHTHHHPDVYNYAHGLYIHADCLPMSRDALDEAVEWSIAQLAKSTEQVGVSALLDEMKYGRIVVPGLTEHLLKDALGRRDEVLVFKNTLLVAHADTYEDDGITLQHRVEQTLRDADDSLGVRDVMCALENYGYSRHSVYQLLIEADWAISLNRSEFTHRDKLGLSGDEIDALLDTAYQALPEDGSATAADTLLGSLVEADSATPGATKLNQRDDGPLALSALANTDDRFATATGGLLGRATADGEYLLRTTIYDIIATMGLAYPREVDQQLRDALHYSGAITTVHGILHAAFDDGTLDRLPGALYFHTSSAKDEADADEDALFDTWSKRPDKVVEAARHPARDTAAAQLVWEMARFIERVLDEDDLAEDLLDSLMARDDVPAEIEEEADALRFALSMGMG